MKTLSIYSNYPQEIIREVNKFRLENKNSWYQLQITCNNYTHKIKAFGTWLQICRTYKNEKLLYNNPSSMDIKPTQFKQHIKDILI
jgi:hypothetical protein